MSARGVAVTETREVVSLGAARLFARAYGPVHAYIFDRFGPYRDLCAQIAERVAAAASSPRRDERILDLLCGPGSLSLMLAGEGFHVTGVDPFPPLLDIACRRARKHGLQNVAFSPLSLRAEHASVRGDFDQVVNVHSLYAHPAPTALLNIAWESLKPGGHAVFVNFARPAPLWSSLRTLARRGGWSAASMGLLWLGPNAVFEAARKPGAAHFWSEDEFGERLHVAGFEVLEMRRTFLEDLSVLAWARKP